MTLERLWVKYLLTMRRTSPFPSLVLARCASFGLSLAFLYVSRVMVPAISFYWIFCPPLCLLHQHWREITCRIRNPLKVLSGFWGPVKGNIAWGLAWIQDEPKRGSFCSFPNVKNFWNFQNLSYTRAQAGILGFCKIPKIWQTWNSPKGGVFKYKDEILKVFYTWVYVHVKILFPLNE